MSCQTLFHVLVFSLKCFLLNVFIRKSSDSANQSRRNGIRRNVVYIVPMTVQPSLSFESCCCRRMLWHVNIGRTNRRPTRNFRRLPPIVSFCERTKKIWFFHFYYTIHCFPLTTVFLYSVFVIGNMHFGQLYCITKIIPISSTYSFPLPFLQKNAIYCLPNSILYLYESIFYWMSTWKSSSSRLKGFGCFKRVVQKF